MRFVADLHIHSKFSRATSRDCDLENLAWWAARKGIAVVGTGDFTHPAWFAELQDKLVAAEAGLYRLRPDLERDVLSRLPPSCRRAVRFMLSVEISTIYKRDERTRKVHHLLYMPDLDAAERCNKTLATIGNIGSDGRPILGLDSRHLLEVALESGDGSYLVPAHVWTPWFAVLGSQSGFDAVEDCYGDLADHVFAIETGLSSDPEMNRRVSLLDRYRLVSNSDAHSPPALGREATLFDAPMDYFSIRSALRTGDGYGGTIEFFPEEGKYHLDGHRKCNVRWSPAETMQRDGICDSCGKPVTVGVLHRVEKLADRNHGARLDQHADHVNLVQLPEILGEIHRVGPKSKRVTRDVVQLTERLGPELEILCDVPLEDLRAFGSDILAEAVARLRRGEVLRESGYDGEYGVIKMFAPGELDTFASHVLFEVPAVVPAATVASASTVHAAPLAPLCNSGVMIGRESSLPIDITDSMTRHDRRFALDDQQQGALDVSSGPLLVIAGPGSGKTHLITARFESMIQRRDVAPERCLAITFTRRACDELRGRMHDRLDDPARSVRVETFHSLALAIVQQHSNRLGLDARLRIATEIEQRNALQQLGVESQRTAHRRLREISKAKRAGSTHELRTRYDETLRRAGLVDFDDLLLFALTLLREHSDVAKYWRDAFDHIAVDEFQDADPMQYELVCLLDGSGNLCVVGDPDQSIYGFRGARVELFAQFERDHPDLTVVRLDGNYRSTQSIVQASSSVIAPATLVPGRTMQAMSSGSNRPVMLHESVDAGAETSYVADEIERLLGGTSHYSFDSGRSQGDGAQIGFSDIAVLYRTDDHAAELQRAFARSGIPVQKRSHNRLLDHSGVAKLATALQEHRCADGSGRSVSECLRDCLVLESILMEGEIEETLALIDPLVDTWGSDKAGFLMDLSLGAEIDTWDPRADRVSLLTIHAAKGLEFDVVFLIGIVDGVMPLVWGDRDESIDVDEERRLLFVGMTRARRHLYVCHALQHPRRKNRPADPSRFLTDLDVPFVERTRSRPVAVDGRQLRLL